MLSGWCIDEIMARDLDYSQSADMFHRRCKSTVCTCPNHEKKEQTHDPDDIQLG